jgi:hypothetical protein
MASPKPPAASAAPATSPVTKPSSSASGAVILNSSSNSIDPNYPVVPQAVERAPLTGTKFGDRRLINHPQRRTREQFGAPA